MGFVTLTLEGVTNLLVAGARALLGDRDWSRPKPGWKFLRTLGLGVTDLHAHIADAKLDLIPTTSRGAALAEWGKVKKVDRKGATVARGDAALQVTGTPAAAVPDASPLTSPATGLRYTTNGAAVVGAGGYVDVSIVSVDTGASTRITAGEILRFDATPAGLDEQATLVKDLTDGGADQEDEGAWRVRILDRFANPPLGGAQNDYVQGSEEVEGVVTAYCYPTRRGLGTVDVAALHDGTGTDRLLSGPELSVLDAKLRTGTTGVWRGKPVAADLRVLTVAATPIDLEGTIQPNGEARYEFDWIDSTPLIVDTWTGGSRTLKFTTDRPDSMQAGGHIVIKDLADLGDGAELLIESLSGTDSIVVAVAPAVAPVAGDSIYSGGPLVEPVRQAWQDLVDLLGTSNPDAAPYGAWEADARPEDLSAAAKGVAGVKGCTMTVPAATVEPADLPYPDDGTVYILTTARKIARRKW